MRSDPAFPFRWRSRYAVIDGTVQRDGRALLFLPDAPEPTLGATLDAPYEGSFRGSGHDILPSTPVCPATWSFELEPGESRSVEVAVPLVPVPALEAAIPQAGHRRGSIRSLSRANDPALAEALRPRPHARDPRAKAHDTFWTSFANMAIARDQVAEDVWVQRVNELQYHTGFWPRDASYFMMAWWYLGMPDEGRPRRRPLLPHPEPTTARSATIPRTSRPSPSPAGSA